jgi:hypothetical protein
MNYRYIVIDREKEKVFSDIFEENCDDEQDNKNNDFLNFVRH